MSIEMPSQTAPVEASSKKHKHKSDKKHKSKDSEKKRKRENVEDGNRSKKHRSEKATADASASHEELPTTTSPFHLQTSSLFLPLAPVSQKFPLEGICAEHLSPLILTYYPPFNGVILSYSNPRLGEKAFGNDGDTTLLQNIDEYAVSWAWVTAEFLLFKPEKGAWLEGYINLQNEGHLGLVCWNLFNASIERARLPKDWKWVGVAEQVKDAEAGQGESYAEDGIGYYVDGEGKKVEGTVKFRVKEIESNHDKERGFLTVDGTMLEEDAEAQLLQTEQAKSRSRDKAGRRLGGSRALGATSLGVPVERDDTEVDSTKKHRRKY
ncbi:RNA polymerase rpb7-like domain-containing protein [Rutstroemia sp. NJR-2017a BVV2]|nr:RNA polymerase rpb7-like domain-containing protein [Rutstroemia sp. NJR-2017a BVV2]